MAHRWTARFLLATMVAVSVLCAPVYCLGEIGIPGLQPAESSPAGAHGCCRSTDASELPLNSQHSNQPGSDEGCETCLFSSGMFDSKTAGGQVVFALPTALDLPPWLGFSMDAEAPLAALRALERDRVASYQVANAPPGGVWMLARNAERRARLCIFLI